jgi:hypothetical protein
LKDFQEEKVSFFRVCCVRRGILFLFPKKKT